jgi:hypothetical protein
LANEEILPEIEVRKYRLANLQPNTQYEVRISYPAYVSPQSVLSSVLSLGPLIHIALSSVSYRIFHFICYTKSTLTTRQIFAKH